MRKVEKRRWASDLPFFKGLRREKGIQNKGWNWSIVIEARCSQLTCFDGDAGGVQMGVMVATPGMS